MDRYMDRRMNRIADGWMDRYMHRCMDEWDR